MVKNNQNDGSLKPRKAPQQKRSQNTMDVILQATGELICTRGLDGFGTNQIADRAGVSIGSLYQYSPDKESILACLIRDMRRQMLQDFRNAVENTKDQPMVVAIEELVTAALRHHMKNPELTQHLERAEDDLPLDHETQALKMAMAEVVTNLLKEHSIVNPDVFNLPPCRIPLSPTKASCTPTLPIMTITKNRLTIKSGRYFCSIRHLLSLPTHFHGHFWQVTWLSFLLRLEV